MHRCTRCVGNNLIGLVLRLVGDAGQLKNFADSRPYSTEWNVVEESALNVP